MAVCHHQYKRRRCIYCGYKKAKPVFKSQAEWEECMALLIERDGPYCWYCRSPFWDPAFCKGAGPIYRDYLLDPSIDHTVPRSKGGADDMDNYRPVCFECNLKKGVLSEEEYRASPELEERQRFVAGKLCHFWIVNRTGAPGFPAKECVPKGVGFDCSTIRS